MNCTRYLKIKSLFFLVISLILINPDQTKASSHYFAVTSRNEVQIVHDIRYGKAPKNIEADLSSDRTLDLYLPQGIRTKLPVLVFVHGGGFAGGDKKSTALICQKIAAQGFAVVSINYYLTLKHEEFVGASCSANMAQGIPKAGFHPALQKAVKSASDDTRLALRWIRKSAKKYQLDCSSVALSGGSAGAMTALYTTYVSGQKILPISAVVNLWGGLEDVGHIKKGAPPLLTFHGDMDKLVHVDFAYALHNRMEEMNNVESKLNVLIGKGHAMYNLIISDKIVEIVEFLKESLKE